MGNDYFFKIYSHDYIVLHTRVTNCVSMETISHCDRFQKQIQLLLSQSRPQRYLLTYNYSARTLPQVPRLLLTFSLCTICLHCRHVSKHMFTVPTLQNFIRIDRAFRNYSTELQELLGLDRMHKKCFIPYIYSSIRLSFSFIHRLIFFTKNVKHFGNRMKVAFRFGTRNIYVTLFTQYLHVPKTKHLLRIFSKYGCL